MAARALYRKYEKALLRYLRGRGDHEAEDHVQQIFAKLFESTTVVESVRAYLFGGACLQARRHLRDSNNRERLLDLQSDVVRAHHERVDAAMDEALIMGEALERVRRTVGELPVELREVVGLRIAGLPLPEIALALELPYAVVKRRNDKAIVSLRTLLGTTEGPFRGDETSTPELSIDEYIEQLAALFQALDRMEAT